MSTLQLSLSSCGRLPASCIHTTPTNFPAQARHVAVRRLAPCRSTGTEDSGKLVSTVQVSADAKPTPQTPPTGEMETPKATAQVPPYGAPRRKTKAESTDAVASLLTRRFGLAGGLGWLAILAVGSLGEQVKTRMEVASEAAATRDVSDAQEVVLPSGVRYTDLRIGGGSYPVKGYLTVVDFKLRANGQLVEDTSTRGKPIVFLFAGRPFVGGMCPGVEEALSGMRAGGKRRVVVPAALGFGEQGAMLRPTEHVPEKRGVVPGGAELEYEIELVRVSIPPS